MKYTDLMLKLQNDNKEKIILMKNGIFFTAIGKDAIALNEAIGLKLTCMKKGLCKVGFQVKSSEKYMKELQDINISFAMYTYDNKTRKRKQNI